MSIPLQVRVAANESLEEVLADMFTPDKLVTQQFDPDESTGFEGGSFLQAIVGVLEPAENQFIKILTPSGVFCPFGVSHSIDPSQGDEVGEYTIEIEDIDPNYGQ